MALDAVCLQAVVGEIAPQIEGLKIEKIQQPARDQVVLLLRGSRRLLLCASAGQPRLNLTAVLRDNPSQPTMFCPRSSTFSPRGVVMSAIGVMIDCRRTG